MLDQETARERALEAAEELFHSRGIQAVGTDAVRNASGISLKCLLSILSCAFAQLRIRTVRSRLVDG
ncbi:hypothetical protein [Streptomyces sp. NPDC006527]|uniref:hypothetical protein n=1 Tax=Streptomyces sp. NPDC006527 TaxID=3364749 RepID=UPI003691428C